MRILITGFEPFGGSDVNSSWEAATRLGKLSFDGVDVVVRRLPVSFRRVGEEVRELLNEFSPDFMLLLGQRSNSTSIDLERIAINMMDSKKGDNDGYIPDEEPICHGAPLALCSDISLKPLRDFLAEEGFEVRISNSAGLYVCNCAYYQTLKAIAEQGAGTKALFVHVPKMSDDVDYEIITDGLKDLICVILKHLYYLNNNNN